MNLSSLVQAKPNPKIPALSPGDTVRVHTRIVEAGKERIQVFQGVVIRLKHGGNAASFTVRHVAYGIGVERSFPFLSPRVEKVEIIRHGRVRRAKLYYLRERSGKSARLRERRVERGKLGFEETVAEEEELPAAEIAVETGEEVTAAEAADQSEKAAEAVAEQPAAEASEEAKE